VDSSTLELRREIFLLLEPDGSFGALVSVDSSAGEASGWLGFKNFLRGGASLTIGLTGVSVCPNVAGCGRGTYDGGGARFFCEDSLGG